MDREQVRRARARWPRTGLNRTKDVHWLDGRPVWVDRRKHRQDAAAAEARR